MPARAAPPRPHRPVATGSVALLSLSCEVCPPEDGSGVGYPPAGGSFGGGVTPGGRGAMNSREFGPQSAPQYSSVLFRWTNLDAGVGEPDTGEPDPGPVV